MPSFDTKQLKAQLKEEKFERSYLIYGEEDYLKHYYSELIASKCVTSGMEGFNLKRFDYSQGSTFEEVRAASETLPAFGGYACVVAKDYPLDSIYASDKSAFESFLKGLPDSTVIIFLQDTVSVDAKRSAKYKSIIAQFQKYGAEICFDRLDVTSLTKIIMSGAAKRGCNIDRETAAYLIETSGNDLTILQNETDKLCNFKNGDQITKTDIDEVCVKSLEASVFDLSRAVTKNDGKKAFSVLHKLFAEKEKPELILGTMIMAFVDMYRAKVAVSSGEKANFAASCYNYRGREFRLRNASYDSRNISIKTLRKNLDSLNEADRKLKIRVTDEKIILEKLLVELLRSEQ